MPTHKDILIENNKVRNMLLPSKYSVEQMDVVHPHIGLSKASGKKRAKPIKTFTNIQKLFYNGRKTIHITDEESKQINISPHVIK